MKQIKLISLVFIFTISYIYSNNKISFEYLILHKWGPDIGFYGYSIFFDNKHNFQARSNIEGGELYSGNYDVQNDKIILTVKNITSNDEDLKKIINKDFIFKYQTSNESVYFTENINSESKIPFGNTFWNLDSKIKDNIKLKFDNIDVVTIEKKASINSDKLFLREKPNTNSRKYKIHLLLNPDSSSKIDSYFLPSDYYVTILCRTTVKEKINDWNNYWYYILIDNFNSSSYLYFENPIEYPGKKTAWVYGEFLKIIE